MNRSRIAALLRELADELERDEAQPARVEASLGDEARAEAKGLRSVPKMQIDTESRSVAL